MFQLSPEITRPNYPLAALTLYNVGGPARVALFPRTADEACEACEWMAAQPGAKLVLGRGSNILVSDRGFDGVVLVTTCLDWITPLGEDRFDVGGGTDLNRLIQEIMLPNNYTGVGGLTGIPGSVGGAIYMNAGTVNGSTCQFLDTVELVGAEGRRTIRIAPSMYGYRGQTFCSRETLILSGVFRFTRAEEDQRPVFDHYMERRRERQPRGRCCGSVFKNPPGDHAGRLIESCGLKGTRHGGAVISPVHANFIMNENNATFEDVLSLIRLCQEAVRDRSGIELEPEVVIVS